jgi:hypothetical protein
MEKLDAALAGEDVEFIQRNLDSQASRWDEKRDLT